MRYLLILVLAFPPGILHAQSEERIDLFSEGVYFFNRQDYKEASLYFMKLIDADPENCHYNFRMGECYMNMRGSEALAVPYFEKAVERIVAKKRYHYGDVFEKNAPLHAWFYLGNVYRIAGRLPEALKAYDSFINSPNYYGNYNINIVENEIKSCERAKIIMDTPVDVIINPVDSLINTPASELYPVVTSDEDKMVFIRKLKFYDAILVVTKQGESWSSPENLNSQIGSDGEFYPVSFSADGNSLYLVRYTVSGKDLYISHFKQGVWSKALPLGKAINSSADETWASVSADGKTLWFTSSRKGGLGGQDIYYSRLDENGEWGKARNAGKTINTVFDEDSPCISVNDSILYFSSKGHDSMGGYDIFKCLRSGNTWQAPVNIGYPINNTSDNTGFMPVYQGKSAYYSFGVPGNGNLEDVYRITFSNTSNP